MANWATYRNFALVFGLAGSGALFLAILADYWLFTSEPRAISFLDGNSTVPTVEVIAVHIHSGLWRICTYAYGK